MKMFSDPAKATGHKMIIAEMERSSGEKVYRVTMQLIDERGVIGSTSEICRTKEDLLRRVEEEIEE